MSSLQTQTRTAEERATARRQVWQAASARRVDFLLSAASAPLRLPLSADNARRHKGSRVPLAVGCMMLAASVFPWLKDPLDGRFSAWQLPVDIGWQAHTSLISYGLLCACGGLLAFGLAFVQWRPALRPLPAGRAYVALGWCCAVPVLLFLLQYLFVDLHSMNVFAQHRREILLLERHLGYNSPQSIIPLQPFQLGISTLLGRVQLLVDQMSYGVFLACACAGLLIGYRLFDRPAGMRVRGSGARRSGLVALLLACIIVLGRAPAAMVCNYEAKLSLAAGDYSGALLWLDGAQALNPVLDQLSFYHEERGEALYYLFPGEQSDNTHAYLAHVYRLQRDTVDAYKELLAGWSTGPTRPTRPGQPWMVDEMSTTLEMQAEYQQSLGTLAAQLTQGMTPARPWLEELLQVDSANVYAQYMEGRMQCAVKNYTACTVYMTNVLYMSRNPILQSSAYTYMGLSAEGQGQYAQARQLLFKAIKLDPSYRNNIAREELSGLH
jgi:hypothetical protein